MEVLFREPQLARLFLRFAATDTQNIGPCPFPFTPGVVGTQCVACYALIRRTTNNNNNYNYNLWNIHNLQFSVFISSSKKRVRWSCPTRKVDLPKADWGDRDTWGLPTSDEQVQKDEPSQWIESRWHWHPTMSFI